MNQAAILLKGKINKNMLFPKIYVKSLSKLEECGGMSHDEEDLAESLKAKIDDIFENVHRLACPCGLFAHQCCVVCLIMC